MIFYSILVILLRSGNIKLSTNEIGIYIAVINRVHLLKMSVHLQLVYCRKLFKTLKRSNVTFGLLPNFNETICICAMCFIL